MAVITISRHFASGGDEIAHTVCEILGYRYVDRALMAEAAMEQGLSESEIIDFSEESYRARSFIDALLNRSTLVGVAQVRATTTRGEDIRVEEPVDESRAAQFVADTIRAVGRRGNVVIVGRGGQAVLRHQPDALHVRVVAEHERRIQRLMDHEAYTREAAEKTVAERDRATAEYLKRFHEIDWADPSLYHLTVNTSLMGMEGSPEVIAAAARRVDEVQAQGARLH